jgi:hypothetical protein
MKKNIRRHSIYCSTPKPLGGLREAGKAATSSKGPTQAIRVISFPPTRREGYLNCYDVSNQAGLGAFHVRRLVGLHFFESQEFESHLGELSTFKDLPQLTLLPDLLCLYLLAADSDDGLCQVGVQDGHGGGDGLDEPDTLEKVRRARPQPLVLVQGLPKEHHC